MRNTKKTVFISIFTVIVSLMIPRTTILADDIVEGNIAISFSDSIERELVEGCPIEEVIASQDDTEEVVGNGEIIVGENVTATVDSNTGAVVLNSSGGTLRGDWISLLDINKEKITSIDVNEASGTIFLPKYPYSMFQGCIRLSKVNLSDFDTSKAITMSRMFANCSSLTELDLSNFNTTNVTTMSSMFSGCSSLERINLSSFDTSKVEDMYSMFSSCSSLTKLDLRNFNTTNVKSMWGMFDECSSLSELNLSSFITSNVTDIRFMFHKCKSLIELDLSGFDTSNLTDLSRVFNECNNLTELDLSSFDTTVVTNMSYLFDGCSNLKKLDLSSFDTSKVINMSYMFYGCKNLTSLDLSSFNTSKVTNMRSMFCHCENLITLDLSNFNTSNVTAMSDMFGNSFTGFNKLMELDLSNFDTSNVTDSITTLLDGCQKLQLLKTPKNNAQSLRLIADMYDSSGKKCDKIPTLSESMVLAGKDYMSRAFGVIDVSNCSASLKPTAYTYDGKAKSPVVKLKYGDIDLIEGTDFRVTYSDNINAGEATVIVEGIDQYNGSQLVPFTIYKASPEFAFESMTVSKLTTDPDFVNALTMTTDGTVRYRSSNNEVATVNATTGVVKITGIGTARITAYAVGGTNYKDNVFIEYILYVKEPRLTPTPTPIPSVTPIPITSGFSDVQDPNHAYYKAIYWAADAGITKGYSDGTFGINRNCTRGEMMMFLWRYAGKPAPKTVSKSPFKDVPKTHTFYKAILWGSQKGITKGYSDGTFGVNRNVSRGECMMFLWRLKGKPAPKAVAKAPFPDVPKSHVFYNAVLWGYQKKITTGFTSGKLKGKFGVNENCSRGQIVTFLYRAK